MIESRRPHLHVAVRTHPGRSGKDNEDRFVVASFRNTARPPVLFAVVADGMGGHPAGDVAAQVAVDKILGEVTASDGADPVGVMVAAIHAANSSIAARSAKNPDEAGMGSTCACVWIEGTRLQAAHVGDSRIYLLRAGQIHQTSVDHTWVQEAVERGVIAPENARGHPSAHVLRRHLGSEEAPDVDTWLWPGGVNEAGSNPAQSLQLLPGDRVMICSDGLSDMLRDDEILAVAEGRGGLDGIAEKLVDSANQAGGYDNITLVLIAVPRWPAFMERMRGWWRRLTP